MKWLLLSVLLSTTDDICRARMHRCEIRCTEDNIVGSMAHLKCNERCWEKQRYCHKEGEW